MELFTLGVSSGYTQSDVTNVARALTGWTLQNYSKSDNYNGATFVDKPAFHDNGSKVILGQTGNWNGYDAIQIILNWSDSGGSKTWRFLREQNWRRCRHYPPPPHPRLPLPPRPVALRRPYPRTPPDMRLRPARQ